MLSDIIKKNHNAVITGGASGIGLAAGKSFTKAGMNILLADIDQKKLEEAQRALSQDAEGQIHIQTCDVSKEDEVRKLADYAQSQMGEVSLLMNNAAVALMDVGKSWENADKWREQLNVNLWGVIYGTQAFIPSMLENQRQAMIINTASKQGITRPPGAPAYNLSKAGVIAFSESLAYELREVKDCSVTAHLLIPGFTYTGMIERFIPQKPPSAWTSQQVVDFMLKSLEKGDFYILCPDNDVTRQMDEKRIEWHADDMIKNRPALSRWHKDYITEFEAFMKGGK